jgi:hypothetical protein
VSDRALLRRDVEALADALLYEGYALYPYRASAPKNRWRWLFGVAYPQGCGEPSMVGCGVLIEGVAATTIDVRLRFLQPLGDEACARSVSVGPLRVVDLEVTPSRNRFSFPAANDERLVAEVELSATAVMTGVHRVTARVANHSTLGPSAAREDAVLRSLASVQLLLFANDGRFVSLQDPPEPLRAAASDCRSEGLWPILTGPSGPPGSRDTILCSPIILEDHAAVAPESPFELCDGTEVVELLTLGLLARSDDERRESAKLGEPLQALVAQAESVGPEALARLHGAIREFRSLGPGSRVRLHPCGRADIFDLALAGRTATVLSVEQDFDGRTYLAVAIDDDPGRDLGRDGRPGHRFFFHPEEVELLKGEEP